MANRKLRVRWKEPSTQTWRAGNNLLTWEIHGDQRKFIVVKGDPSAPGRIARQLKGKHAEELAGAPILYLPPGAEFEVWEVDE